MWWNRKLIQDILGEKAPVRSKESSRVRSKKDSGAKVGKEQGRSREDELKQTVILKLEKVIT